MNLPIIFSPYPSTPHSQDFCVDLDCKPNGCRVFLSSKHLSIGSFDPINFGLLCSSILDSTCDVHEDQVLDGVGVQQLTCTIIFYEYVWECENESIVKHDLLLSAPCSPYPEIFHDSAIFIPSRENSSPYVSTSDHLQNT